MAGIVKGSVDHVSNTPATSGSIQEMFTNVYRFFNGLASSSYVTLVALQTGSTPTGAPINSGGTNYHNERNPFGENAWAVWKVPSGSNAGGVSRRTVDYYFLMQWASGQTFGSAPGNPGLVFGSGGSSGELAFAVAYNDDGTSPWLGTTLANGNDTKGATVWNTGSHCFPRSNSIGGNHTTLRQNTISAVGISFAANTSYRYHMIMDRDTFVFIFDISDNLSYDNWMYFGWYEPLALISTGSGGSLPMAMCMAMTTVPGTNRNATYGDLAGTTTAQNGGIVAPVMTSAGQCRGYITDRYQTLQGVTTYSPNQQLVSASFDEFRVPIIVSDSPDFGHVGYFDLFTEVYNCGQNAITSGSGFTKVVFNQGGATIGMVVPWSGSNPPAFTSTRGGRQF